MIEIATSTDTCNDAVTSLIAKHVCRSKNKEINSIVECGCILCSDEMQHGGKKCKRCARVVELSF